jgi:prepilin-type N-terminal cleavage/methylation domain-containing protein
MGEMINMRTKMTNGGNIGNRGFTLVELLVVVSIIAVASAIAIPSFVNWGSKFRLRASADEIAKNMLLARMKAISTNRDVEIKFYEVEKKYEVIHEGKTEVFELPKDVNFGELDEDEVTHLAVDKVTFKPAGHAEIVFNKSTFNVKLYSTAEKLTDKKRKVTVKAVTGIVKVTRGW